MATRHLMGSPVSSHHYPHFPFQTLTLIGTFLTFSKILNFINFSFSSQQTQNLAYQRHVTSSPIQHPTPPPPRSTTTIPHPTPPPQERVFTVMSFFRKKSNFRITNIKTYQKPLSATPTLSERRYARMPSISTINSSALNQQNNAQQISSTQQIGKLIFF